MLHEIDWGYFIPLTIATIAFIALVIWDVRREHVHPCQDLIDLDAKFRKIIREITELNEKEQSK